MELESVTEEHHGLVLMSMKNAKPVEDSADLETDIFRAKVCKFCLALLSYYYY